MSPPDDLKGESGTCPEPVVARLGNGHGNGHTGQPPAGWRPLGLMVSHPGGGVCVVRGTGELDALTAPALTDCVCGQVIGGAKAVGNGLGGGGFLGSAGLGYPPG